MDDIQVIVKEVEAATDRLINSATELSQSQIAEPSALPGWSRGHVLTHLARNADGLRALLLSARSRTALRMYASPSTRVADIDAGATRPADVIAVDLVEASRRFLAEMHAMPSASWSRTVAFTSGAEPSPPLVKAADIAVMRLQEIELHHIDLDVDYSVRNVPTPVAVRLLERVVRQRDRQSLRIRVTATDSSWAGGADADTADTIATGTARSLLGWLSGRTDGRDVEARPTLPALPPLS